MARSTQLLGAIEQLAKLNDEAKSASSTASHWAKRTVVSLFVCS